METHRLLIFGILVLFLIERVEPFEYSEKDQWPELYEGCAGNRQSPINLSTTRVGISKFARFLDVFKKHEVVFVGYDDEFDLSTTVLLNTGSSVQLTAETSTGAIPTITGNLLPGDFKAHSLHFHWGSTNDQGAEHLVDGEQYSMELHIVHVNSKYGSLEVAQDYSDGLAVLGIFFEISEYQSSLTPIIDHLNEVVLTNSQTQLTTSFSLNSLIEGLDTSNFFSYKGSLTTPDCSEAVTWTVFQNPLPITENELLAFRQLLDANRNPIVDNYRNPQSIGNRVVKLIQN